MLLAASLLIQAIEPIAMPTPLPAEGAEMRDALGRANVAIMRADVCASDRPAFDARIEPIRARLVAVMNRTESLYGRRVTMLVGGVDTVVPCRRADRARYRRVAAAAVSRADALLERRVAAQRGLWLGPFRLCRDTVESVRLVEDVDGSSRPVIRFAPAMRGALRAETEARIGQPMGIYLDGRLIVAPVVQEPFAAEMQISGPDDLQEIERMRTAAARPC